MQRLLKLDAPSFLEVNGQDKTEDKTENIPIETDSYPQETEDGESGRPLDERKLDYIQSTPGTKPRAQSSVSSFLRSVKRSATLCASDSQVYRSTNPSPYSSRATELGMTPPIAPSSFILIL